MTLADQVAQAAPEAVREQGMQKDKPLIIAHREGLHALLQAAHRTGFDHLAFVTAVDWPADKLEEHADEGWLPDFVGAAYGTSEADASEESPAEGGDDEAIGLIELVYNLYSYEKNEHLAVQCWVPRDLEDCWAPSVADIWRGANWHERETYDLYGVTFRDHPNLTRIFMPEEWDGHPGRKDYDLTQEQFIYRRDDGTDGVSKDPGKGW